jgi:hypothetical protein
MAKVKKPKKAKKETEKEKEERLKREKRKEQIGSENQILKNLFIGIGIFAIGFLVILAVSAPEEFEYRGVDFDVIKFCDSGPCLVTYHTTIPTVNQQGKKANYNFYLRNDPRQLEKEVPFEGTFSLKDDMFVKITFDNYCKGFETIALENFLTLHRVLGVNVGSEDEFTCSPSGAETHVLIQEGNETFIEQVGDSCYVINVKDCEILEGTERFMIETFAIINFFF